jgi:hypothetical protein
MSHNNIEIMTTILLEDITTFETEYKGEDKTSILEEVKGSKEYAASISWQKHEEASKQKEKHAAELEAATTALNTALAPSYPRLKDVLSHSFGDKYYRSFTPCDGFLSDRQLFALNEKVSAQRAVSAARMHFDSEFVSHVQSLFMAQTEAEAQLQVSIASSKKAEDEAHAFWQDDHNIEDLVRAKARHLRHLVRDQQP